jgi:S1-C subfamily serine protease
MKAMADGISFAIPSDTAKKILSELEKHGMIRRPYLGLQLRSVDAAMVAKIIRSNPELPLSSNVTHGLLVIGVRRQGPAHRCGLRDLDVITHVRGVPVERVDDFINDVQQHFEQGIPVTVMRGARGMQYELVLVPEVIGPRRR